MSFGDRRSMLGLAATERGDRSMESRELCKGDGESDSDLAAPTPLLSLLTLGVAGDALLGVAGDALLGVSDKEDLFQVDNFHNYHQAYDKYKHNPCP